MPKFDEMGFVERQQFFNGQRLVADDLQGLETFHRELRELHNRSLHQPGIGNGFAVSGERGDRKVTIGPGYAIDAVGHELILAELHKEPVPPVEGEDDGGPVFYYLTVSYPSNDDLEESETRAGICHPRGVVRLREEPVFCWVRLVRDESGRLVARNLRLRNDINAGRKILLAQVEVQHCELQKLSIAQRRNARPPTQPYIACGKATPAWTIEFQNEDSELPPELFLTAKIDTHEANFLTTPCYSARIHGPRQLHYLALPGTGGIVKVGFFAEALLSIDHDPAPSGFGVTLLVIMDFRILANSDFREAAKSNPREVFNWDIEWMGVE